MSERPLADLHRHLDGSLRLETLRELAAQLDITLPEQLRFTPDMGLQGALERFAITLSVLQTSAAVRRVAAEICQDAAAEQVTTLELRFAPQLHKGAPLEAIVDAACEGLAGRAGLILCGLYGEPPELIERLVEVALPRPGVVGLDLAGGPASDQNWALEDYARAFTRARDGGLGRTVHAGEGRPPEEIRTAIEKLHAQRIGHGTTLLDDSSVLALVCQREITIEACPTSNVHTGVIAEVAAHPLPRWLEAGVKVCVCTDNTLFSDVSAPAELANVAAIPGMTPTRIERIIAACHAAAFSRP